MPERTGETALERCPDCDAAALYCPLHGDRFTCIFCTEAIYVAPGLIPLIRKFGIACDSCRGQRTFKQGDEVVGDEVVKPLPAKFQPGEGFHEIAKRVADLVAEKNICYGSSFDDCSTFLRLLWPRGVPIEQYSDMLAIVRIWDKLKRIATDRDALGEDPFRDILGYCLLALRRAEEVKHMAEETE